MPYFGNEPAKVAMKVGSGVITATEIQDASISTADIANDAITPNQLDDDGTGFQVGTLGVGTAVSGSEKLTVGGTASFSGEVDAASLDISGDVDVDGTLETDALTIGGVTLAETIADTVGAMVGSNTETGIAVTYEDSDNTLDFVLSAAQTGITSVGTLGNTDFLSNSVQIRAGQVLVSESGGSQSYLYSGGSFTALRTTSAHPLHLSANYSSGDDALVIGTDSNVTFAGSALVANGSAGSPSHSFSNNADSGMYSPADNQLAFASGGTQALIFGGDQSATFAGDVQINKSSPVLVLGNGGNTTNSGIRVGGDNDAGSRVYIQANSDNSYIDCYGGEGSTGRYRDLMIGARSLTLRTGSAQSLGTVLTLDSSQNATFAGDINVNKANPTIMLNSASAQQANSGKIRMSEHATGANDYFDIYQNGSDNELVIESNEKSAILKFSRGNGNAFFGGDINTTNHEVVHETGFGYDASTYKVIQFGGDKGGNKTISLGYDPSENDNGSFAGSGDEILTRKAVTWKTPNTNDDGWHTPMAWNDGDIIMYGLLTLAHDSNEKLHLQGSTQPLIRWKEGTTNKAYIQWQDDGGWHFVNEEASGHIYMHTNSGNFNVVGDGGTVEIDSDGSTMSFSKDATNQVRTTGASSILKMMAESNGVQLNNSATSWSAVSSDERLKTNWTMFENATDKINTLTKIGTYNPIDKEDVLLTGLSANEVQKVLPSAVFENEDGYLGMNYQDVFCLMLKSIQELTARLEALEGN
tara:strand:- start:887 stop:3151 length:2265 start_codon:yes stop_codon:yes gene_type:complete